MSAPHRFSACTRCRSSALCVCVYFRVLLWHTTLMRAWSRASTSSFFLVCVAIATSFVFMYTTPPLLSCLDARASRFLLCDSFPFLKKEEWATERCAGMRGWRRAPCCPPCPQALFTTTHSGCRPQRGVRSSSLSARVGPLLKGRWMWRRGCWAACRFARS